MTHSTFAVRAFRAALIALCCPVAITLTAGLSGCSEVTNNPHPPGSEKTNTMFVPFTQRSPKYLDPTSSYSNDETPFTYQVYEPLYGYHYLKRPYELQGRTAEEIARPHYFDKDGKPLPDDAPGDLIAESVFDIKIKPGIMFAPHPAFAKDAKGDYVYHDMKREDVADKYKVTDFKQTGTRELTADDYVYAHPPAGHAADQVAVVLHDVRLHRRPEGIRRQDRRDRQGDSRGDRRPPTAICRSSTSANIRSPAPRRSTSTRCASASRASIRSSSTGCR